MVVVGRLVGTFEPALAMVVIAQAASANPRANTAPPSQTAGRLGGRNGKGMSQPSASPAMIASNNASGGRMTTAAVSALLFMARSPSPPPWVDGPEQTTTISPMGARPRMFPGSPCSGDAESVGTPPALTRPLRAGARGEAPGEDGWAIRPERVAAAICDAGLAKTSPVRGSKRAPALCIKPLGARQPSVPHWSLPLRLPRLWLPRHP